MVYAVTLLSFVCFIMCCHGNESMDTHTILDKAVMSLPKRSDGLMRELVDLLVDQRNERKILLKKCKYVENIVKKLTKVYDVINRSMDHLKRTTTRQHADTKKNINTFKRIVKDMDSLSRKRAGQLNSLQNEIHTIKSFAKGKEIGFSVKFNGRYTFKKNDIFKFNKIMSNYGNGYSTSTGKFTCKIPGLYFFTISIISYTNYGTAWIVKNTSDVVEALTTSVSTVLFKQRFESGSTSAVLKLNIGDKVWVKTYSKATYEWNSCFSGMLIS